MYELILPLGIINFLLVAVQVLGGLKVIKVSYKTHKYLGIALCFFVILHGAIAVFLS
jgi:hypothetical protein